VAHAAMRQEDVMANAVPGPPEGEGTFPLPLTPPMIGFLTRRTRRVRQRAIIGAAIALLLLPLFLRLDAGYLGVLLLVAIVGYGLYNETMGRVNARDDLAAGTYNHYVGPVAVKEDRVSDAGGLVGPGGDTARLRYRVTVPGQTFWLNREAGRSVRDLRWAKVDYLDEAGLGGPTALLLSIRDADDRLLYRHTDYRPA
jgi:hypothetical protein